MSKQPLVISTHLPGPMVNNHLSSLQDETSLDVICLAVARGSKSARGIFDILFSYLSTHDQYGSVNPMPFDFLSRA